jgi:ribonuclease Z
VIFLGTAASIPTIARALPSVVVKRKNEILMFDCGEGVQRQMIKAKVGFHKKMKIFPLTRIIIWLLLMDLKLSL